MNKKLRFELDGKGAYLDLSFKIYAQQVRVFEVEIEVVNCTGKREREESNDS